MKKVNKREIKLNEVPQFFRCNKKNCGGILLATLAVNFGQIYGLCPDCGAIYKYEPDLNGIEVPIKI